MHKEYPLGNWPDQQDREAKEDMARLAPEYWAHQRALEEGARIEYTTHAAHEREVELDLRDLRRQEFAAARYAEVAEEVEALPLRPRGMLPPRFTVDVDGW